MKIDERVRLVAVLRRILNWRSIERMLQFMERYGSSGPLVDGRGFIEMKVHKWRDEAFREGGGSDG